MNYKILKPCLKGEKVKIMSSYFNEENTVEQMVLDTLCGKTANNTIAEPQADYLDSHLILQISSLKWRFVAADDLPRQHSDVLVESMVRDALIHLNPEIKAQPDRADEVLYRLRTIPLSVQSEGLGLVNPGVCRMAAGREVHALRRAHAGHADRLREPEQ